MSHTNDMECNHCFGKFCQCHRFIILRHKKTQEETLLCSESCKIGFLEMNDIDLKEYDVE